LDSGLRERHLQGDARSRPRSQSRTAQKELTRRSPNIATSPRRRPARRRRVAGAKKKDPAPAAGSAQRSRTRQEKTSSRERAGQGTGEEASKGGGSENYSRPEIAKTLMIASIGSEARTEAAAIAYSLPPSVSGERSA